MFNPVLLSLLVPLFMSVHPLAPEVEEAPATPTKVTATPRLLSIEELKTYMASHADKTLVVNFWATWCRPCVAELPHFERFHQEADANTHVLLVSLDNPETAQEVVPTLLTKKGITAEVVILNEQDPNEWIPALHADEWSGSIPATMVVSGGDLTQQRFHQGELSFEALEAFVAKASAH